ncbi:cilia- and flagella-associated protein 410-like isoform X1 [Anneissia japonica]|uniref:cilia- and flagella-associated protein 410-like isoform X1 n=2 Tax=Anneissia japonica TaxID=1529436 RepID=UPI0014256C49|nr:cilia- and flagella-associated protein 410-like isoform X1 [Anneissia japonica]
MVKLTEGLVLARARASDLENVRKLNCWAACLTDVSILRQMPSLEVIGLSVNSLTTLEDFLHCPNLVELYIRKNCIADLSEIWHLRKLPKLRVLWLADNPCAAGDMYRMTVLKILPNLQRLDNVAVTSEEVHRALELGDDLPYPLTKCNSNGNISLYKDKPDGPIELSLGETNKIRQQLGLRALPAEKISPMKSHHRSGKSRNSNVLQAVLALIKELDQDSLEVVANACRDKLDSL